MMEYIKITDDPAEIVAIGKKIFEERQDIYSNKPLVSFLNDGVEKLKKFCPERSAEELLYRSIYDYWVYGVSIDQELYLKFYEKDHEEKSQWLTGKTGRLYFDHLNDKSKRDDLQNKYSTYLSLKDYYKREVILISGEEDYDKFCTFVGRHPDFCVKPTNLGLGLGIRKETTSGGRETLRQIFDRLIVDSNKSGRDYHLRVRGYSSYHSIVLEELIDQDETLAGLHPSSVNCVRCTTVYVDRKVHLFYPWIKIGTNNMFVSNGAAGGILAGIDPSTGVINTDGLTETGETYEYHPTTGVKIKGFAIPRWKEMLEMADVLGRSLEGFHYVGWDLALSKKGWCVMEGNYAGELALLQLFPQKGLKREFEELIKWKPDQQFWWE